MARSIPLLFSLMCLASVCGREGIAPDRTCEAGGGDLACAGAAACTAHADCPQGTVCESGCCQTSPFDVPSPDSLLKGFGVREFELVHAESDSGPTFGFRAPRQARFLVCGLFGCEPSFASFGAERARMVNASRCLVQRRVFRVDDPHDPAGREFSFELQDMEAVERRECTGRSRFNDFTGDGDYPVINSLQVGCWAYDDAAVVAATRLDTLAPQEFPSFGDVARDDCSAADSEGQYCYRAPAGGACLAGACEAGATPSINAVNDAGLPTGNVTCSPDNDGQPCLNMTRRLGRCLNRGCVDLAVRAPERPLVLSDCAVGATDWLNCFPSQVGAIGTCKDKLCRVRCHDDADCDLLDEIATSSGGSGAARLELTCVRGAREQYLGLCEAPLEPR